MERIAETPPASPAPPGGRRSGARSRPLDGARGAAPARCRYSPRRRARRSLPWSWPLEAWVDPWRPRGRPDEGDTAENIGMEVPRSLIRRQGCGSFARIRAHNHPALSAEVGYIRLRPRLRATELG